MEKKQVLPIDFLWLALYAFAGFSLELILGMFLRDLTLAANAGVTAVLWTGVSLFLVHFAKRRFNFDVFRISHPLEKKASNADYWSCDCRDHCLFLRLRGLQTDC